MKAFIIHILFALVFIISAFIEKELPLYGDVIVYCISILYVFYAYLRMKSERRK